MSFSSESSSIVGRRHSVKDSFQFVSMGAEIVASDKLGTLSNSSVTPHSGCLSLKNTNAPT